VDAQKIGDMTRTDVLLEESLATLAPLIRLLLANGVTYPQFVAALKLSFLRAAQSELAAGGKKVTDSAISLLSGVHRKDVRELAGSDALPEQRLDRAKSLPDEVFMRWTNDPQYLDADGLPKVLPLRSRTADEPSFEQLSLSISRDFHSRAVLEELVRLELAEVNADTVRLRSTSYVPLAGLTEALQFMSAAVADHIAAAAANVRAIQTGTKPGFLEQSIYADELSEESVMELQRLGRRIWESALRRTYALASERSEIDRKSALVDQTMRMRFGVYFYAEPASPLAPRPDIPIESSKDEQ
jgi:Family of unknown function (DUF6502)